MKGTLPFNSTSARDEHWFIPVVVVNLLKGCIFGAMPSKGNLSLACLLPDALLPGLSALRIIDGKDTLDSESAIIRRVACSEVDTDSPLHMKFTPYEVFLTGNKVNVPIRI